MKTKPESKQRVIENGDAIYVSSRAVASHFGKDHWDVLRRIDTLIHQMNNLGHDQTRYFKPASVFHEPTHQVYREYHISKEGFSLLIMGFTGQDSLLLKLQYIDALTRLNEYLGRVERQQGDSKGKGLAARIRFWK